MARPSAGSADPLSPLILPTRSTAVITDARMTEGEGRTKKMKAIRINAVIRIRVRKPRTKKASIHKRNAAMIAKFSPLTAVRCVRPERRISSTKFVLSSDVSPRTSPGMSAPLSPPIVRAVALKARRIAPEIALIGSVELTCTRVERVAMIAATRRSLVAKTEPEPATWDPGKKCTIFVLEILTGT